MKRRGLFYAWRGKRDSRIIENCQKSAFLGFFLFRFFVRFSKIKIYLEYMLGFDEVFLWLIR